MVTIDDVRAPALRLPRPIDEMRELILDAWRRVVAKRVAAAFDDA